MPQRPNRSLPSQPPGQHRRRGARDEDHGPGRPAPGRAGEISGARGALDGDQCDRRARPARRSTRRWRRRSPTASPAFALVGAAARMVDAGARCARRGGARRASSSGDGGVRLRQRAGRPDQRGNARLPVPGAHPGQSGVQLAEPGAGGAGCCVRTVHGFFGTCSSRMQKRKARHRCRTAKGSTSTWSAPPSKANSSTRRPAPKLPTRLRRLFSRVPDLEREEVNILRGLLNALQGTKPK